MAIILGINAYHPGSSAALLADGVPLAAIAEERLNRIKNYGGFPSLAIQECLKIAGLTWQDVDAVTVGRDPYANWIYKALYSISRPHMAGNFRRIFGRRHSLDDIRLLISKNCNVDTDSLGFKVFHVEHHMAHTASAYFASPWDTATSITIDGSGDFVTCMIAKCEGQNITVKKKIFVPNSLGLLYTTLCQFIGFNSYGDEGKVMGLAPFGHDNYADLLNQMVSLNQQKLKLNSRFVAPFGSNQGIIIRKDGSVGLEQHYTSKLIDALGKPRMAEEALSQRDMDIACSLQNKFESIYLGLVNLASEDSTSNRLALAGGCALNSVANGKIFSTTPFSKTWIQPAAGDDGLALGSALYVSNTILKEPNRWVMENSYLGPEYTDYEIESDLKRAGIQYIKLSQLDMLDLTATALSEGDVVGWFQGRMEWGPRALGNRSILAHPGFPNMKSILNDRIKNREAFRPFAPAVLAEHQNEIFDHSYPSPYMLHVYGIRPKWREKLSAVNHIDNTGRLQTVSERENPVYYSLISRFHSKTGIPVILNTSFNENEPIVCKPSEAIDCFRRTKMDILAIGSFLCRKNI